MELTDVLKNCIIPRYDKTITRPPFLTIPIDTVQVPEPISNGDGRHEFALRLTAACRMFGHTFKFYSMSEQEGVDYELVVY